MRRLEVIVELKPSELAGLTVFLTSAENQIRASGGGRLWVETEGDPREFKTTSIAFAELKEARRGEKGALGYPTTKVKLVIIETLAETRQDEHGARVIKLPYQMFIQLLKSMNIFREMTASETGQLNDNQ